MPKIKDKERILKTAREKHSVTYKGAPTRLSDDFLKKKPMQTRRDWQEIFKEIKSKDLQLRLLYPAKPSFRTGEIKSSPDKKMVKEFVTIKPIFRKMLESPLRRREYQKYEQ